VRERSILIAMLLLPALPVCAAEVTGSGRVVEQTRTVADFSSIEVASGIQVRVENGPKSGLTLRGEDNILPHVRTDVSGSTLQIGFERGLSVHTQVGVVVSMRAPRLDGIGASGGSEVQAGTQSGESLELRASGGAHIRLSAAVKPRKLQLQASGGSEIAAESIDAGTVTARGAGGAVLRLAGRAQQLQLEFLGGTVVRASGLTVQALTVDGSGGGVAKLRVTGSVRGALSGGATLHVGPGANVEVSTSGGAEVVKN